MRKFLFVLVIFAFIGIGAFAAGAKDAGSGSGSTAVVPLPAADVAAQGFNYYSGAASYNKIKDTLGPIDVSKLTGPLTIGFCAKALENEFWRMEKEGAEAAAAALKAQGLNITVNVRAAQGETDELGQLAVLNDMVNRKYTAIMVSPIADGNLLPGVEEGIKANIPMLVCNDAFMPQIRNTIGAWHMEGAEMAAEWIGKKLGGSGQVGVVAGLPKNEVGRIRAEGVVNYMKKNYPNITIAGN